MLFFGDIEGLHSRSSVRSQVQTTGTKDSTVHRYVIACEINRAKGASELADTIRRLASQWEHPLSGLWVVETTFKAQDIRSALLSHMEPQDRLFITEAGQDKAEANALHGERGEGHANRPGHATRRGAGQEPHADRHLQPLR